MRAAQALYMGRQWRRALALLRGAGLVEADVRGRYLAARCLMEVRQPQGGRLPSPFVSSCCCTLDICWGATWPRASSWRWASDAFTSRMSLFLLYAAAAAPLRCAKRLK